ncbi:AbrB/MazE/SpoVT family DNA-binding domain-containing protein (plasmid) [Bacillus cereus]|uniref:AbrB/MazE/SpoVT family DNA-binding domain-containing protein n=1 Tax=Bacillus cereus TaxID=1396 RepID=UPI001F3C6469|nr:AbrB/MazE/SpoVT family DNA-binding domain-containing protein [Bacillus cereus]UIJ69580.1 AbrB/MazE/SpoVT family DNA-binding domain-containing protein [Bacillus cereus]
MKKTGVMRRVDDLGRIVLPKEIRRTLDLLPNTSVEMYVLEGTVRIKQQPRACFITGQTSENQIELYDGRLILSQEGAKDLMETLKSWLP